MFFNKKKKEFSKNDKSQINSFFKIINYYIEFIYLIIKRKNLIKIIFEY